MEFERLALGKRIEGAPGPGRGSRRSLALSARIAGKKNDPYVRSARETADLALVALVLGILQHKHFLVEFLDPVAEAKEHDHLVGRKQESAARTTSSTEASNRDVRQSAQDAG